MNSREPDQTNPAKGYFSQIDPAHTAPITGPEKSAWPTRFARAVKRPVFWIFLAAILITVGILFIYNNNPYGAHLTKSISLLNEAVTLTDPQGTGAYFSYWDDKITAMIAEGLEEADAGQAIYDNQIYKTLLKSEIYRVYMYQTSEALAGYRQSRQTGDTSEETILNQTSGEKRMATARKYAANWMQYWEENGEAILDQLHWWWPIIH